MAKKKQMKKGSMKSKGAYIKYRKKVISEGGIPDNYGAWLSKQAVK